MRFITPDLLSRRLSDDDDVLDEVEQLWDEMSNKYREYYNSIEADLPKGLRQIHESYYLHDAQILMIGQQKDRCVVVLRLDTPPRSVLILTYELASAVSMTPGSDAHGRNSNGAPEWQYDEVSRSDAVPAVFTHQILLSDGREISIPLRDVQVTEVQPLIAFVDDISPSAISTSPSAADGQ